jgi:MOSC domain-containing protein
MSSQVLLPTLANIRLHPIKSLDPVSVSEARISPSGGLALDRVWALHSVDGKWVNGKRTPLIHHIRANYAPDLRSVTLSMPTDRREIPTRTFAFPEAHEDAAEWFSVFFEHDIAVRYSPGGFPDDTIANGPTIVSTASLRAVAEWFTLRAEASTPSPEGSSLTPDDVRLRFRTTLEIDGVPPFWEDQLFSANERNSVRFTIGDVHFEGSNPCARCPVPPRDPHTGTILEGFQKRFTELRESTLPPSSPRDRFDHFYRLSTNTRVAPSESGKLLRLHSPLTFT